MVYSGFLPPAAPGVTWQPVENVIVTFSTSPSAEQSSARSQNSDQRRYFVIHAMMQPPKLSAH
jgi:hypothetical protein